MASYGWPCDDCGSRDCDGCAEPHPDHGQKVRTHCPDCGRIHWREYDFYGDLPKELKCRACVSSWWPAPPGPVLNPVSVLKMQRMVKDAGANGDKPWPYLGAA